jgi:hypothetical protein
MGTLESSSRVAVVARSECSEYTHSCSLSPVAISLSCIAALGDSEAFEGIVLVIERLGSFLSKELLGNKGEAGSLYKYALELEAHIPKCVGHLDSDLSATE